MRFGVSAGARLQQPRMQLEEIVALVESSLRSGPRTPPPPAPSAGGPAARLHAGRRRNHLARHGGVVRRGALAAGHRDDELLAWGSGPSRSPGGGAGRRRGDRRHPPRARYAPLVKGASAPDTAPAVRSVTPPPASTPICSPCRASSVPAGSGDREKVRHDHPYTGFPQWARLEVGVALGRGGGIVRSAASGPAGPIPRLRAHFVTCASAGSRSFSSTCCR
jgi:hypothetical protein